jgi:hypothetical protein
MLLAWLSALQIVGMSLALYALVRITNIHAQPGRSLLHKPAEV